MTHAADRLSRRALLGASVAWLAGLADAKEDLRVIDIHQHAMRIIKMKW